MKNSAMITIAGAGLAGCEAAVSLARAGIEVELLEMKPVSYSPAHQLPGPAELVCSNSLKSDSIETAHGLLKDEMRHLGSVMLEAATEAQVPAGSALAVDRAKFSQAVSQILARFPNIHYREGVEVSALPAGEVIVATGPLTSEGLVAELQSRLGGGADLYFYDALAPIVDTESIDHDQVFAGSRWGKGGGDGDYLNCPLSEQEYRDFVAALKNAPTTALHDFENVRYFEGCLPIEVLAARGDETLAFGPMRPVGLTEEKDRPYAVVQLRCENKAKTAYNLVGFQTKLTQAGQREVIRMIPGLAQVQFLRYGAIHRNLYVNGPQVLTDSFQLRGEPRVRLSGQIVGVEGYMESAAMGILVGWFVSRLRADLPVPPPPPDTALGALYAHVRGQPPQDPYEPMNIHFGLLPPIRQRGRRARRQAAVQKAQQSLQTWLKTWKSA